MTTTATSQQHPCYHSLRASFLATLPAAERAAAAAKIDTRADEAYRQGIARLAAEHGEREAKRLFTMLTRPSSLKYALNT